MGADRALFTKGIHDIVNDTAEPIEAVFIKSTLKPDDKIDVK